MAWVTVQYAEMLVLWPWCGLKH